jgi:hypothetical protein
MRAVREFTFNDQGHVRFCVAYFNKSYVKSCMYALKMFFSELVCMQIIK